MSDHQLPPGVLLVWEVRPDPDGNFDVVIVGSADQAGELAARAAESLWDDGEGDEPAQPATITCRLMSKKEFEELAEPMMAFDWSRVKPSTPPAAALRVHTKEWR